MTTRPNTTWSAHEGFVASPGLAFRPYGDSGPGNGAGEQGGGVFAWERSRREASAGRSGRQFDPVDAEGPPVVFAHVPGQQVPAARGVHQPVRLHFARRRPGGPR